MKDVKVTVASMRSILIDPQQNLERVRQACATAERDGARMVFLPELMLTGHGGHPKMAGNAEAVPGGPLASAVVDLSKEHDLCVCVGLAELDRGIVYNSQMVADRGAYLGCQRKIHLSGDEYLYFGAGQHVEVFDIGEVRFGITICYDNHFPELGLLHRLNDVDLILAPHAARSGSWPDPVTPDFTAARRRAQQDNWEMVHRAYAFFFNTFQLVNNAVGPSTEGLEDVVAIHPGTLMAVAPDREVILRSESDELVDEVVTVELVAGARKFNHNFTRTRRRDTLARLMRGALADG